MVFKKEYNNFVSVITNRLRLPIDVNCAISTILLNTIN